ncbi:MAG: hypothetical protein DMG05_22140 [Acidobacteria bacterium]|nr:MAG: hypothetical protein DMG05_22140 [Acidobacteriota bacterium]
MSELALFQFSSGESYTPLGSECANKSGAKSILETVYSELSIPGLSGFHYEGGALEAIPLPPTVVSAFFLLCNAFRQMGPDSREHHAKKIGLPF